MGIIIDRITFENYRQYGSGFLSFKQEGENNLSVLIAQNGTGKTTLLNAITWCLYDVEKHLADEKTALPLLNTAVAREAVIGTVLPVSVTLTILDDDNIVEFYRTVDFKISKDGSGNLRQIPGKSKFSVSITPTNDFENTDVKQGTDADVVVKQYFDEAIFKFYFFDGEKLRDFFATGQTDTIKQSVFNISQVTMLDNACNRLRKMKTERTKRLAKDSPDIAALNEERDKVETSLALANATLDDNKINEGQLSRRRQELDDILRSHEPIKKLQQERQSLESSIKLIEREEKELANDKAVFIRYYITILTLYPRVKRTLDLIKAKEANGDLPPAIDKDQVRMLLDNLDLPCPLCDHEIGETGRKHLEGLLEKISVSSQTSNYLKEIKSPLEVIIEQSHKFKETLDFLRQREMDISSRKREAEDRLRQITALLTNYESESDEMNVSQLEIERSNIINQISTANQAIGAARTNINNYEKRLGDIDNEIKAALQKMNEHDDIRKQVEVIDGLWEKFSKIKSQIMDEIKSEIEKMTWDIFDSMIWKRQTFGKIKIGDSYGIAVYSTDGIEMTGSLSATEQMALAYAFTLAIHRASGKNCPLVIDSPLGRVSDDNRENMAKALQKVSKEKQIIMLFTPDEYSPAVEEMYKNTASVRKLMLTDDESYVEGIDH